MKPRLVLTFLLALSLGLVQAASAEKEPGHHEGESHSQDSEHEEHGGEEAHDEHGVVRLTAAELDEFGIKVTEAGPGLIETHLELPGEVQPNASRLAHIVPRFSGIVTEVRAEIGDYVKRGQVLAIIESDESLAPFEVKTLIAGTVITSTMSLTRGDIAYALVILWAFAGIAVKHANVQPVMLTAWIMACVVAITLVVGQYIRQRRRTQ